MPTLRILIADDHEVVRHGIRVLLESHPAWQVCGEATDGRQAVEMEKQLRPDLVILDIGMPNLNGLDASRQILARNSRQRILILTIYETEQVVKAVLEAGARGFVLKSDAGHDLIAAVEALHQNRTFFTSRVAEMVLKGYLKPDEKQADPEVARPALTAREREVVQLLAEGKSTKEVAVMLNLSVKTAETHRSNIMRKLGLHCLSELVLYAVRNGIIQIAKPILEESSAEQLEIARPALTPS